MWGSFRASSRKARVRAHNKFHIRASQCVTIEWAQRGYELERSIMLVQSEKARPLTTPSLAADSHRTVEDFDNLSRIPLSRNSEAKDQCNLMWNDNHNNFE